MGCGAGWSGREPPGIAYKTWNRRGIATWETVSLRVMSCNDVHGVSRENVYELHTGLVLRGWCPQGRGGSSPPSDTPGDRRFLYQSGRSHIVRFTSACTRVQWRLRRREQSMPERPRNSGHARRPNVCARAPHRPKQIKSGSPLSRAPAIS
jgi:hypothetical protein